MGEQLTQNTIIKDFTFDIYTSLSIGSSTINQLKKDKKIPDLDYGEYKNLKPDGLLIDQRNPLNVKVICVIEFKAPSEFNTKSKKIEATKQCNTYCHLLNSYFGVITDGEDFIWINPKSEAPEVTYYDDEIFPNKPHTKRGYSHILREDGYELSLPFILNSSKTEEFQETKKMVSKVLEHINKNNSQFIQQEYINPSKLAHSIWQDVWISKSASPEKSLSTFIEIFMFKFLSDLDVLKEDQNGNRVSFSNVINKGRDKCLNYYFSNVRDYIKSLFPINEEDGTTLINGISLSPTVQEDNQVFYRILNKFKDFGNLRNIDPEFKSRLFEDFLKKSISKKNWGQFFTPRNVVKAIVEMSEIEKLPDGARVYDPACGVGGFIL